MSVYVCAAAVAVALSFGNKEIILQENLAIVCQLYGSLLKHLPV